MRVLERNVVVYVNVAGVAQVVSQMRRPPLAGLYPAFLVGLEGDRFQALRDQHFLPRVLAVSVGVNPVLPVAAVVVGDARRDGGDGDYQGGCRLGSSLPSPSRSPSPLGLGP